MSHVSAEELTLAGYTTLRLGGPARRMVAASDAMEIAQSVRDGDAEGEPVLLLGGGSNVVIADAGFPGTVIVLRSGGVRVTAGGGRSDVEVTVQVAAGEPWDQVVRTAVSSGWAGLECLSGIPGSAGATPIQNVGAYGQEVAETITAVRALDRRTGRIDWLDSAVCGFGYRTSVFRGSDRWVVLEVEFRLRRDSESAPLRYPELAQALGVPVGGRAPLAAVRAAVLELRAGKGMVLNPSDPDTYSAGSFFTNPVLAAEEFETLRRVADGAGAMPAWPQPDGRVKVGAAWLIDRAGFGKGYPGQGVAISSKHTLALTNRGAGTTGALLALAAEIRDGVAARFGVELVPEPVLVNCALPPLHPPR